MPTGDERQPLSSLLAEVIADWEQVFSPAGSGRGSAPASLVTDGNSGPAHAADVAGAGVLERLRAVEAQLRQREQAERLRIIEHAITATLAKTADLQSALAEVLRCVCQGLGWQAGVAWRLDRDTNLLNSPCHWHVSSVAGSTLAALIPGAISLGMDLPGRVWANGRCEWANEQHDWHRSATATRAGLGAAIGFPINDGDRFLGVLEFFSNEMVQPDGEVHESFTSIGSQLGQFMERWTAWQAEDKRRMETTLARRVWMAFLPDAAPVLPGYEIGGGTYPAEDVGGDFLDYFDLPGGSLGIAIGDATGHGVSAALVIFQLCSYLRALALTERSVARILALANRRLAHDVPEGFFVSLVLAQLDVATGTLIYGNAGHPAGYVIDARGSVRLMLNSTGLLLGVDPSDACPTGAPVMLKPGEMVFLLTDGIIEAQAGDGQPFGPERALELVRDHRQEHPDAIVRALVNAVRSYAPDYQHDDMTAIIVKALATPGPR
jgi:serine phosphatase RsbU (regulator of sigma subunit)